MRIMKCLVTIALLGSASLSLAAGNPEAGEEKAALCAGCHGDDGNAAAPIFPKLAGQHASFLIKQLHDFRSQKRVEPTMNAMAEPLTDEDVLDLAAFYTSKKITTEEAAPNQAGEKLYKAGNLATGVPACTGCHGPKGRGNPSAGFPSLHGQYAAYLEKTLHDFRSGERANDSNEMMRKVAKHMSDEEIAAVSDYASTLK
jgi:cytochrome c553